MKILLHDYAGHPFQAQLSRALAARGHHVTHVYSNSNPTSPKGALRRLPTDPATLVFDTISLPRDVTKTSLYDRWRLERMYGRLLAEKTAQLAPDIVISANTPLDSLNALNRACQRLGKPWVFWLQDLIGQASVRILQTKLPVIGAFIGKYYSHTEARLLRSSGAVIGIAEEFRAEAVQAGVGPARYTTIPNWAPLDEITPAPKHNAWSEQQGLANKFVYLYSGTLGFKHNPKLFVTLAEALQNDPSACVVVNSEGPAADWLRDQVAVNGLTNLIVNPFQPYEAMSQVLGTADVLMSILEPEAGAFSIPSKVLSYHCAGRAMLLAIPDGNLAARIVNRERTGLVVDPGDPESFVAAALRLKSLPDECADMAVRARAYAEKTFNIDIITRQFEVVLANAS
jgi:glycosyltransferase involved in cell wall biosynthesis